MDHSSLWRPSLRMASLQSNPNAGLRGAAHCLSVHFTFGTLFKVGRHKDVVIFFNARSAPSLSISARRRASFGTNRWHLSFWSSSSLDGWTGPGGGGGEWMRVNKNNSSSEDWETSFLRPAKHKTRKHLAPKKHLCLFDTRGPSLDHFGSSCYTPLKAVLPTPPLY